MPAPFKGAVVRRAVLARRAFHRHRRHLAERLGSARYSRPALFELDRKLGAYLDDGGFFVEAGANDGFRQSNTYYLERFRGWRGVLIEPNLALAASCRRERPDSVVYQCALVADERSTTIEMRYADLMSEVLATGRSVPASSAWDPTYVLTVPARTLASILEEVGAPRVDLLSLDVQGFEAAALTGMDLPRFMPRWMLIEIEDAESRHHIEEVIGNDYTLEAWPTPCDALYRCRPGSDCAQRLA